VATETTTAKVIAALVELWMPLPMMDDIVRNKAADPSPAAIETSNLRSIFFPFTKNHL
jgi:hypothetical protein